MELKEFTVGELMSKSYIISENGNALIIDPGAEGEKLYNYLQENGLKLKYIINTHGHFDHIAANQYLKEKTGAEILGHPKLDSKLKDPNLNLSQVFMQQKIKSPALDRPLNDNDLLDFENLKLRVLYTPGHSADGISIYLENNKILFSGDCIFAAGVGRTDLSDSSFQQLINSIEEKLFSLPEDTVFYPGHGPKGTISTFKNRVWPAVK
ncbi:MBL fold metallo-hydrolase [Halanaerobium congolense]|jgi:glyoxylase-like metal-dependent hydrolase (beta-lactamase superfamily II)|uniref:MBL fold metallo-hydrolase n=1 Tax=Halanaerobium congolense TaxID=54121 RepID=UPI00086BDBB0|nr:MBL fold metallo-hydrolase [Halanaerobium congolense]OEG62334.1 MAG: MBL fold metallo-hydrolase [Halanaerobium sp. MDAL1]SDG98987.1 Glyoxylase, beta-lactamase superfamily II [Halanaerobium congolense]